MSESFYDLKLRKNAMALLSKVTVVVAPSQQLDTPAPMTGDPLDTVERPEFIDPPDLVNNTASIWLGIFNPQGFLPPPEVNDGTPPPTVFRNNFYQVIREPNARRAVRNVMLPAIASDTATIVYQGVNRINDLEMPQPQGGNPVGGIAPNIINGRDLEIADLLTYDYQSGPTWYSGARGASEQETNAELNTMGPAKIAHAWVMCGKAYVLMTSGDIYRSQDGFNNEMEEHGKVYQEGKPITRNHPGQLWVEYEPYT